MRKPLTVSRSTLLIDGSDQSFRAFLHSFMIFARRLEAIRDGLAKQVNVTAPQYEMLSHLREAPRGEGLTVTAIAERLHCTGSFATTEVGKLQRAGLVDKRRDAQDARRLCITTTAACELRFQKIAPLQRRLNDRLFKSLTAHDLRTLHRIFPALVTDGDRAVALATALVGSQEFGALAG